MSNYTKSTNFTAKDSLPTGDTNKVIRGSEFDTEFNALETAIGTKADLAGPTFTGTATFANLTATGTVNLNGATVSDLGSVTTVDINGGTIDAAVIGGATPAAGSFTTLSASSTFTLGGVAVTSTAAELNILDGVTSSAAELNILDGKSFLDEDDLSSDSATGIPSQQSVKAYVDAQTGLGGATLAGLADTNITSPADAALLFYDTGTSKWIDNVVSGDITIADTGVAAIGAGVIVNADVNASAAISVSKTALVDGTGLTLTGDTLSVDASQTQITAVGTIATGTWQGTAIANAYVADDLTISGGTVDNSVIGGTTAAAGTFTTLTGNQLDVDNIQIDANAVKSTNTNGNIELFPNGTGTTVLYGNTNPGTIVFNCESNSHGVTLKGPAHSAASTYTVALPDTLGTTQASGVVTSDSSSKVKFIGTTSVAEMIEKVDISTSTSGTINFDFLAQAVQLYNTNQTANRTINFRGDSSNSLNSIMATGESMTAAVLMKQGSSAYYLNTYQVDGSSVTPEWSGGSAPSAGNANSIDSYVFTIIKTADATFTVLAGQSQYA